MPISWCVAAMLNGAQPRLSSHPRLYCLYLSVGDIFVSHRNARNAFMQFYACANTFAYICMCSYQYRMLGYDTPGVSLLKRQWLVHHCISLHHCCLTAPCCTLRPPPFQAERPRAQCKVGGVEMHAGSHCWGDLPRRLSSVSFEQARGARWIGERWWAPYAEWIQLGQAWIVTNPRNKGSFPGQVTSMGRLGRDRGMYLPQNVTEQSWNREQWSDYELQRVADCCGRCRDRVFDYVSEHHGSTMSTFDQLWSAVISCDQHGPRIQQKVSTLSFSGQSRFSLILKSWGLHFGGVTVFAHILAIAAIALICSYPPPYSASSSS